MIIQVYQIGRIKMVKIKLSKNFKTFAAENFKVRNWVVIYQKTSLIIEKSERVGNFFLMILLHKWHFKWES